MSWTLIERQVLSSSAATVTLGSGGTIPQTYRSLKVVISARSDRTNAAANALAFKVNGSSTGYSHRFVYGDSSAAASGDGTGQFYSFAVSTNAATSDIHGSLSIEFPNYSTTSNKVVYIDGASENNAGAQFSAYIGLSTGVWNNSSGITSIAFNVDTANSFIANSTFSLYGLK